MTWCPTWTRPGSQNTQTHQQMYGTALERLELNDREDQFSGSPLQMRSEDTIASNFSNR